MKDFGLYVIITRPVLPLREIASICVHAGVRCLQLREKDLSDRDVLKAAAEMLSVTRGTDTLLFINDRVDLALAAGADGVHLGQDDLPIETARRLAGSRSLRVGLSTHSPDQARAALAHQPDYIGFGPIYETPTKAVPDPVVGVGQLREVLAFADRPVVAIGGIDDTNLDAVLSAGARNVCLVRHLMSSPDLAARIRALQTRIAAFQTKAEAQSMQIDTTYLAELFGDDVGQAGRVLAMMFASCDQQLQHLRRALADGDRDGIAAAAHQMAGATATCGLMQLSKRLRALEAAAESDPLDTMSPETDVIAHLLEQAQSEGQRLFPAPAGASPDA